MPSRFDRLDLEGYVLPVELERELLSPALVVYLDQVRENLRRMLAYLDGQPSRWRPHLKTTKIPAVYREVVRSGVRQFKCATLREARCLLEVLDTEGLGGDLLVAYPLVGPALDRLGRLAREHDRSSVSVLCEDPETLDTIPNEVDIFVDVNPGMHRTGLPLERRNDIVRVAQRAGARFRGVHFYDGHIRGEQARRRKERAFEAYGRLIDLVELLGREGAPPREIVTSGTPTFRQALAYPGFADLGSTVHRVSPGTVVFHDLMSEQEVEELDLLPAALLLSRVISHPAPSIVTCDAGSKSIAAEVGDPCAYVLGHPAIEAIRPSEEHLPLRVHSGAVPARGEILLLVPRHVCPTVNLADEAVLVEAGAVVDVVPVAARGHDLR